MPAQTVGWQSLLGMGVVVAAQIGVFIALGLVIDSVAGTSPVFLLIGVFVGVVGAIVYAVVKFRQYLPSTHENRS